jgi:tRNA-binding EMAP/Myf-like protein
MVIINLQSLNRKGWRTFLPRSILKLKALKNEEIKRGLKGLVIGEVLSTEKHPNGDKLTLTKVSDGVSSSRLIFHFSIL